MNKISLFEEAYLGSHLWDCVELIFLGCYPLPSVIMQNCIFHCFKIATAMGNKISVIYGVDLPKTANIIEVIFKAAT